MADYEFVRYEVQSAIAWITLDRPEVRNAQSRGLLAELRAALDEAEADDAITVVVLRGAGPVFSAGHDMGSPAARAEWLGPAQHPSFRTHGGTRQAVEQRLLQEHRYFFETSKRLRDLPKITIAQVHGQVVAAGLMLMWPCDLVVAASGTRFVDPVGTKMAMCGVEYFAHPWELGPRKAKEMLLLGEPVDAEEALRLGMVNRVVPAAELDAEVSRLAERVAALPSITSLLVKQAVNQAQDQAGFQTALAGAFHLHQLNHAYWAETTGGASIVGPAVALDPAANG